MTPLGLWKPWYVYRPGQLARRLWRAARRGDPVRVATLPWGCPIEIDTRETVGRSIWETGLYDLAVAEVLARLTGRDDLAVDAGANIGAMTGLLASRAAEVWAFEPHPAVAARLAGNVGRFAGRPGFAPCTVYPLALSDADGTAELVCPDGFAGNQGTARIGAGGVAVETARLDRLLGGRPVGVMKLDVEGHELAVLGGAAESLAAGRVRDIVFEDHAGADSPVARHLAGRGYTVFGVGWRMDGPAVAPPPAVPRRAYEAPSYLATRRPDEVLELCRPRGWRCFNTRG